MGGDDGYDRQIERRIEKLEERVESLINWRNWMLGTATGIGMMTGAFAKQVAYILTHLG